LTPDLTINQLDRSQKVQREKEVLDEKDSHVFITRGFVSDACRRSVGYAASIII
jgi:hypothetical protein